MGPGGGPMSSSCFCLPRTSILIAISAGLALPLPAADYAKQARDAVAAPFKVSIKPLREGQKAGEPIEVDLQLQNGKSQPSEATSPTMVQVQILSANSGQVVESQNCAIRAKSTDASCTLRAQQPGIYRLKAVPSDHRLLEGTGFLQVLPNTGVRGAPPKAKENSAKPRARFTEGPRPAWLLRDGGFLFNAAWQVNGAGGAALPGGAAGAP